MTTDKLARTWDDVLDGIPADLRDDGDVLVKWVTVGGGEPMHALSRLLRALACYRADVGDTPSSALSDAEELCRLTAELDRHRVAGDALARAADPIVAEWMNVYRGEFAAQWLHLDRMNKAWRSVRGDAPAAAMTGADLADQRRRERETGTGPFRDDPLSTVERLGAWQAPADARETPLSERVTDPDLAAACRDFEGRAPSDDVPWWVALHMYNVVAEHTAAAAPADDTAAPSADEVLLVPLDGRKGGQVTVGHSRLPVTTVLRALGRDGTVETARAAYPDLTEQQGRVLDALRRELPSAGTTLPAVIAELRHQRDQNYRDPGNFREAFDASIDFVERAMSMVPADDTAAPDARPTTVTVSLPANEHDIDGEDAEGRWTQNPAWETRGIESGLITAWAEGVSIEDVLHDEGDVLELEETAHKVLAAVAWHQHYARAAAARPVRDGGEPK